MSRSSTLVNLRGYVCDRADIVEGSRHPTATLNRRINQAIQRFRREVTECGCEYYLVRLPMQTSASTTANPSGWAPCDYLVLPNDFYHLSGIDIMAGGSTYAMMDFVRAERNQFQDYLTEAGVSIIRGSGLPIYYRISGQLRNIISYDDSLIVQLIPRADAVYNVTLWYLAIPRDLVVDADTFDGIAGYEEWVVNRAALDSLMHDGVTSGPQYAAISQENAALEAKMKYEFSTTATPGRRVNTDWLRRKLQFANRWRAW
jgi:hypothetical protein